MELDAVFGWVFSCARVCDGLSCFSDWNLVGADMSDLIQWIIVIALVVAALTFLIIRLRPSKKSCCSGCPYAGSCSSASEHLNKCGEPELLEKQKEHDPSPHTPE